MRTKEYVQTPAFSNSFSSRVKSVLMGQEPFMGSPAAVFGEAVHQSILEPHLYKRDSFPLLKESDFKKIASMKDALKSNRLWSYTKDLKGETEKQVIWKDEETGLLCKGILDRMVGNDVMDIKTTSATDVTEFIRHIKKYEYERQAAMYLDATNREYFTWVCLSKRKNISFNYTLHRDDKLIESGRKKYRFLLKKCKALGIEPGDSVEAIKLKFQKSKQ